MFLFPHIAEKVHEEIEEVTSGQRLPQVADRPNLRFTEAVWKEAWRWQPFSTLGKFDQISESSTDCDVGIPHVNTQDEIVNGYLIPKGSLININTGYVAKRPNILNYDDEVKVHAHQSRRVGRP
jgi:Cytochrome P450